MTGSDAPASNRVRVLPNLVSAVLVVGSLVAMFYPNVAAHIRSSSVSLNFNDDARQQIWPFLRYRNAALFRDDYLADYQVDMNPIGFGALYGVSARLVDPRVLSKVVPYCLLAVTLVAVGLSAWRLGGAAVAWGALALCCSSDAYLEAATGGLPRAFGYPLTAMMAASLVLGKPNGIAAAAILGAAFYYPISVLAIVVLALLLFVPGGWTGAPDTRTFRHRAVMLGATAALSLLVMLPSLISMRPYGPTVGPGDWAHYPEAGPGGRLADADLVARPPLSNLFESVDLWATRALKSAAQSWSGRVKDVGERYTGLIMAGITAIVLVGYLRLIREEQAARRLLVLPAAAVAMYLLSWLFVPHLYVPSRYLKFTIPISVTLMLPGAMWAVARYIKLTRPRRLAGVITVCGCAAILVLLGGRGSRDAGLTVRLDMQEQPFFDFVSALPPTALIAGWPETADEWPQQHASINDVPYLTGRRVLVSRETHLPFHRAYLDAMRPRMEALMEAYFAVEPAPLIRLRSHFGVTHLLVDKRHYQGDGPTYFKPFDAEIPRLVSQLTAGSEVLRQASWAAVFEDRNMVLLDLARIR